MGIWGGGTGVFIGSKIIELGAEFFNTSKKVAQTEGGKSAGISGTVATMYAALTTSVEGIRFLDDPIGFVEAVVFQLIESTVYYIVGSIAITIGDLWDLLISTVATIGGSIVSPFGSVGDVITDLLADLASLIAGAAQAAGPLAVPLSVLLWATVTIAVVGVLFGLWELYKLIRTVVV